MAPYNFSSIEYKPNLIPYQLPLFWTDKERHGVEISGSTFTYAKVLTDIIIWMYRSAFPDDIFVYFIGRNFLNATNSDSSGNDVDAGPLTGALDSVNDVVPAAEPIFNIISGIPNSQQVLTEQLPILGPFLTLFISAFLFPLQMVVCYIFRNACCKVCGMGGGKLTYDAMMLQRKSLKYSSVFMTMVCAALIIAASVAAQVVSVPFIDTAPAFAYNITKYVLSDLIRYKNNIISEVFYILEEYFPMVINHIKDVNLEHISEAIEEGVDYTLDYFNSTPAFVESIIGSVKALNGSLGELSSSLQEINDNTDASVAAYMDTRNAFSLIKQGCLESLTVFVSRLVCPHVPDGNDLPLLSDVETLDPAIFNDFFHHFETIDFDLLRSKVETLNEFINVTFRNKLIEDLNTTISGVESETNTYVADFTRGIKALGRDSLLPIQNDSFKSTLDFASFGTKIAESYKSYVLGGTYGVTIFLITMGAALFLFLICGIWGLRGQPFPCKNRNRLANFGGKGLKRNNIVICVVYPFLAIFGAILLLIGIHISLIGDSMESKTIFTSVLEKSHILPKELEFGGKTFRIPSYASTIEACGNDEGLLASWDRDPTVYGDIIDLNSFRNFKDKIDIGKSIDDVDALSSLKNNPIRDATIPDYSAQIATAVDSIEQSQWFEPTPDLSDSAEYFGTPLTNPSHLTALINLTMAMARTFDDYGQADLSEGSANVSRSLARIIGSLDNITRILQGDVTNHLKSMSDSLMMGQDTVMQLILRIEGFGKSPELTDKIERLVHTLAITEDLLQGFEQQIINVFSRCGIIAIVYDVLTAVVLNHISTTMNFIWVCLVCICAGLYFGYYATVNASKFYERYVDAALLIDKGKDDRKPDRHLLPLASEDLSKPENATDDLPRVPFKDDGTPSQNVPDSTLNVQDDTPPAMVNSRLSNKEERASRTYSIASEKPIDNSIHSGTSTAAGVPDQVLPDSALPSHEQPSADTNTLPHNQSHGSVKYSSAHKFASEHVDLEDSVSGDSKRKQPLDDFKSESDSEVPGSAEEEFIDSALIVLGSEQMMNLKSKGR